MREATRLAEDSRLLYNVPVTIPLHFQADESEKKKVEQKKEQESGAKSEESQESKGSTVRHAIGMTGSSEEKVHAYLRTLLVDYAAFHSPQDAMLYVAGTSTARRYWRWAYALPHCKEGDKTETLMFEQDERPGENEIDRMRLFWKNIRTILERRRTRLQDRESGADVKLPFMLVVVDVRNSRSGLVGAQRYRG
jgi:DNA segregation ATPase FtsK/SpoIIIE-like protein